MTQLRYSPSGPLILGASPGDVLAWSGTEWLPGPLAVESGFNFVINDLAELTAAAPIVGGVHVAPAGSYSVKGSVAVANPIRPSGNTLWQCMGNGALSSSVGGGSAIFEAVAGTTCSLIAPRLTAIAGSVLLSAGPSSVVNIVNGDLQHDNNGIVANAAQLRVANTRFGGNAASRALVLTDGNTNVACCEVFGGGALQIDDTGGAARLSVGGLIHNMAGSGETGIILNAGAWRVNIANLHQHNGDGTAISFLGAGRLNLTNWLCQIEAGGDTGLHINDIANGGKISVANSVIDAPAGDIFITGGNNPGSIHLNSCELDGGGLSGLSSVSAFAMIRQVRASGVRVAETVITP